MNMTKAYYKISTGNTAWKMFFPLLISLMAMPIFAEASGGSGSGSGSPVKIVATKIVCDDESLLPNWGLGGPDIVASTAANYVSTHPGCHFEQNWKFQWGFGAKSGHTGVRDLTGDFVGEADGSKGQGTNTGTGYSDWKTFGPTNASGTAVVSISDLHGATRIWVREVLQDGYVPFTYYPGHAINTNNVSAELYCHTDVLNYDNYDYIQNPIPGKTYYCVAFNARESLPPPPINHKPVITLIGSSSLTIFAGISWTDPGATVMDDEDGDITWKLVTGGTVDTNVPGTYTITYNATDTAGLAADEKTRTVTVVAAPACSDDQDNDHDGHVDYPDDPGCTDPDDGDENTKPVITVLGDLVTLLTINSVWTDPGATVMDNEDGDITWKLVTSGTVDTMTLGTYTITYNATDTAGLAADEKTRTVRVTSACSDGSDNDHDTLVDFPADAGCTTPEDNDENTKPVITLLGDDPLELTVGAPFVDPGANATDVEDCFGKTQEECNTILHLSASGFVDTNTVGTYTISYTAWDSQNEYADPVLRIVRVNPPVTECNDGVTNDADSFVDYPQDPGCTSGDDNDENEPPYITLRGDNPFVIYLNHSFTDPLADVDDPEEGDIDSALVVGGAVVDTNVLGSYVITYNATDGDGAAAPEQTRTVHVVAICSDSIDNDTDGFVDYPADPGCSSSDDDTEEDPINHKPVITLIGSSSLTIFAGISWTDPGATVMDDEDGDITWKLVTGGTVDTNVPGTYTITYNATDTAGLAADEKTRTVTVVAAPACSDDQDNDHDGLVDYPDDPGCTDPDDGDETDTPPPPQCADGADNDGDTKADYPADPGCDNSLDNDETDTPLPPPGGGGGGSVPLTITNEQLVVVGDNTVRITWNTNLPATSRVVYGLDPVITLGQPPLYGYTLSTATVTDVTTSHTVLIDGIPSGVSTYFRPVSTAETQTATGIELIRGAVLGATTEECFYLRDYLRLGANNNPVEVRKLQTFLRDFEGFSTIAVTGFFDLETDRAVRIFQDRYAQDVLEPWNLPGNTGYVYYTTRKKINEIYCARAFPLTDAQIAEITAFRALMEQVARNGHIAARATDTSQTVVEQKHEVAQQYQQTTDNTRVTSPLSLDAERVRNDGAQNNATQGTKDDDPVRLTIADILATIPGNAEKLAVGTTTLPAASAVGTQSGNTHEKDLAAVGKSKQSWTQVMIFLILIAVLVGGIMLYRRKEQNV